MKRSIYALRTKKHLKFEGRDILNTLYFLKSQEKRRLKKQARDISKTDLAES
jgi:hypothetical protein